MLKANKKTLIIASIVTIMPLFIGLLFWNRLPDVMATHFGMDNEANGWSSKVFAVFGLPLFLVAMEWIMAAVTSQDPRRQNISPKLFTLILWENGYLVLRNDIHGPHVHRDRQLHAQDTAELHDRHKDPMDPGRRGELEQDAPPGRIPVGRGRDPHAPRGAYGIYEYPVVLRDLNCHDDRAVCVFLLAACAGEGRLKPPAYSVRKCIEEIRKKAVTNERIQRIRDPEPLS